MTEPTSATPAQDEAPASGLPSQVPPPPRKRRRRVLKAVSLIVGILGLIVIGLFALAASNDGTRFILDQIAARQKLVTYHYVRGNLQDGVVLDHFKVGLEKTDITAKRIVARIGWRAIIEGQVHLVDTTIDDLVIYSKTPSTGQPYHYPPIRLPFVLRVNRGTLNGLTISQAVHDHLTGKLEPRVDASFQTIHIKRAKWDNDLLSLNDSSISSPEFSADQVKGTMQFNQHYPIAMKGRLIIPLLHQEGFPPFDAEVGGDLEEIHAGLRAQTPDPMTGTLMLRPMDRVFVLKGQIKWQNFNWPLVASQHFYSKQGQAVISSLPHGLAIHVVTDWSGVDVPQGQYDLHLFTDYKGLDFQSISGKIAGGSLSGFGRLDWHGDVHWFLQGQMSGVDTSHLLPVTVRSYAAYMPKALTGPFRQTGLISHHQSQIGVRLTGASGEQWIVGVGRGGSIGNEKLPLAVVARWRDLDRAFPGVGVVNSQSGSASVLMNQGKISVKAMTDLLPGGDHLPQGHYEATLLSQATGITVPAVTYQGAAGALNVAANMNYAIPAAPKKTAKPMTWDAKATTTGLDLTSIVGAPIQHLQGDIQASGTGSGATQTITVIPTLSGMLSNGNKGASPRNISLTGKGVAVLQMAQAAAKAKVPAASAANKTARSSATVATAAASQQDALKAFSVQFDGDLKAANAPSGSLNIRISGTPDQLKIERFEHNGAAGQISATGLVATKGGLSWQATGALKGFNLGFFVPSYVSNLSGSFNTTGEWNSTARHVQISQLNLSGSLKNQPLMAQGTADAIFDSKSSNPLPARMSANNLMLDWAGNRLMANGGIVNGTAGSPTGNLSINVDARNLGQLSSELAGRVTGQVILAGQTSNPDLQVNLVLDQFRMNTLLVNHATLVGNIPQLGLQPGQLLLDVNGLRHGKQIINGFSAKLVGSRQAHTLDVQAKTQKTRLGIEVAGGLDAQLNWQGQIRQGSIVTPELNFKQDQPAALQYLSQMQAISLAAHCWSGAGRLCLAEPLTVSSDAGHVVLALDALDLGSFKDIMPSGMVWTGKLQGQAQANWQAHATPVINAQVYTENGTLGLAADDPQDPPSTLPYQRLSLVVATQSDGIKVRFDAKTPNIGTGYIDALIDHKPEGNTINGALVLDNVQLQILKPFLPGMRELSGVASLAGGMSGPLTGPQFYGEFKLNGGKVVASNLPINLHDINFVSSIRGTGATLQGQFVSGDGVGTLTGSAIWADRPEINLKLVGKELMIRMPPQLSAWLNPALDIQILPMDSQVNINGRVDVPQAIVTPGANSGSNAITKSADVRIVYSDQATEAVLKNVKAWAINADIDVAMGDHVYFRGFGANARIIGGIHVHQQGQSAMTAKGQISLQRNARLEAYGQALTLSKSNVMFNGLVTQPLLDIEAYKMVDNHTVGIRVTGQVNNPKITTFNDAGLSELETYSAILSGHINTPSSTINNTAGFRSDVNNALAAAGISAGLSGSRGFTNKLGSAFGLSNLAFGAEGDGTDTKVNVTGYLAPDLYIRYGVGVFTPVNKLTLRYQMTQRFYMEASSSLDRAIDFFYNWQF